MSDKDKVQVMRFKAQVAKVQTLADGGIRLILDLSENEIDVARELMRARKDHFILEIAAVAVVPGEGGTASGKVDVDKMLREMNNEEE